jgi:hypothetical protein
MSVGMLEKTYTRNDNIVTRKISGELLLVPIQGNLADMQRIFTLNPVGEHIWKGLDGERNLQDICRGVVREFEVEEADAAADIREFIGELLEADLISVGKN